MSELNFVRTAFKYRQSTKMFHARAKPFFYQLNCLFVCLFFFFLPFSLPLQSRFRQVPYEVKH